MAQAIWGIAVLLFLVAAIVQMRRKRHGARRFDVGPAAIGSVYDRVRPHINEHL